MNLSHSSETTELLKLRLNMIKFDNNYGKKDKKLEKVAETMEHLLECKETKN